MTNIIREPKLTPAKTVEEVKTLPVWEDIVDIIEMIKENGSIIKADGTEASIEEVVSAMLLMKTDGLDVDVVVNGIHIKKKFTVAETVLLMSGGIKND